MGNFDDFIAEQAALTKQLHPEAFAAPADPAESEQASGVLGTAKVLGYGLYDAVTDQLPEDLARMYRGGADVHQDSWAKRVIDQQAADKAERAPSRQALIGNSELNRSIYEGSQSIAGSGALGITGMLAGGIAGPGGAALTSGALVGAGAYRQAKDQILQQAYEHALQLKPDLTGDEWQNLAQDLEGKASEYGAWEAIPQAVMQAATIGLIKGIPGSIIGKIPGLGGITEKIGGNVFSRVGAKLGADVVGENIEEGITFMGQGGVEKELGLRSTDPTINEYIDTQAGPVTAGALINMGITGGVEKFAQKFAAKEVPSAGQMAEQIAAQAAGQEKPQTTTEIVPLAQPQTPQIPGMEAQAIPEQGTPGDSAALMAALRDVRAQQFGRGNLQTDGGRGPFEAPGVDPLQAGVPPQIRAEQIAPGYGPLAAENDAWMNAPVPPQEGPADVAALEAFRREQMARSVMQPEQEPGFPQAQAPAPAAPVQTAQPTFDRELEQAQDMEPAQPEVTVEPLARPSLPTTPVRAEGVVPATDLLASPQDRATVLPGEAKAVETSAPTQTLQEPVSAPPAPEPTQTPAKVENAQHTAAPSVAPTAEPQPEAGKVLRVFPTPGGNVEVAKTGSSFTVTMRGEGGAPIQAGENFKSETDAVRAAKRLAQPKSEPAAVQTQPQAAPSLAELEAKLGPDTADFIRKKVVGLGGVEAVSQRYRNNDAVSRYARAFADQHFATQAEATSEAAQPAEAEAAPQVEQKPAAAQPAEAVQDEPAPQPTGGGGGTAGGEVAKPKSKHQRTSKEERTLAKMEAEVRQKHLRDLKHRVTDFDGNPREVRITREGPDHVSVKVKDFRGEWVQMPNQSMSAGGSKKDVQRNKFWPDDLARETFQSTHKGQFASIWPARYTEFHIDSIKRPTAAQMNLTKSVLPTWMAIEAKGKKGWSDGRMADFGNLPYKEDPKNYLLDNDPEPKDFTRIIGRVSYSDPKLTPRFIQQDGEGGKIIFSVDGEPRLVSAPIRDFAYFVSKYGKGEITLHQRSAEEPIGVVKAGEIDPVGVFMPMKQPPDRPLDLAEIRRQIQEDNVGKDGKAIREADEQEQPAEARQEEEAAAQEAQPEQEPIAAPEGREKPMLRPGDKSEDFASAPDEGKEYGEMPASVAATWGGKAGPIRLLPGDKYSGAEHIERRHGDQIRGLGFKGVEDFVSHVVSNFNAVYAGSGRAVILTVRGDRPWKAASIKMEYNPEGDFWSVQSAAPMRPDYFVHKDGLEKKKLLWEGAQANHLLRKKTPSAVSGQSSFSAENSAEKTISPKQDLGKALTAAKVKAALKGTAFEGLTVLDSPEDLTDRQFYRQLEEAGQLGAKGAYDPNTRKAYVFAGNNADMADAFVTAAHEGGHEGIGVLRANAARSMGGDVRQGAHAVNNILDAIYAANARKIQKEIALGDYKELDMRDAKDRRRATEEWLMANEPTQTRWYDKYVAAMTRFMRAVAKHLDIQIAWTDTETRDFLAKAYKARQQGGEGVRVFGVQEEAGVYRKRGNETSDEMIGGGGVAWTDKRIEKELAYSSYYDGRSKAMVAWISPEDFLTATTKDDAVRSRIVAEAGSLDLDKLRNQSQTPFLQVNGDGVQWSHEGRHRMAALAAAGVKSVPIVIDYGRGEKRGKAASLSFEAERPGHGKVTVTNAIPLAEQFRDDIKKAMAGDERVMFRKASSVPTAKKALDDADEILKDVPIEAGTKRDLSAVRAMLALPHWIAKDFPVVGKLYDRQMRRVEDRSTQVTRALAQAESFLNLKGKDLDKATEIVHQIDGKKIEELGAWQQADGKLDNGRTRLALREDHYNTLETYLQDSLGANSTVAKAIADARRTLDSGYIKLYNRFASMKDADDGEVTKLRTSFGKIHNYFPHVREGDFYVKATSPTEKDENGRPKTLYREHFNVLGGSIDTGSPKVMQARLEKEARRKIAELKAQYPDAKWSFGEVSKLPEAVFQFPIPVEAIEQVIKAGTKDLPTDDGNGKNVRADVEKMLEKGMADVLKARGFGQHLITRQNVPGYITNDVKGVFFSHINGLYGFMTKMEAARDFTRSMREFAAAKEPRLYDYGLRYMTDMLQNASKVDRTVGILKSIGFAKYLGLRLSTAAVNLTQNIISGIPTLSMHTDKAGKYYWSALANLTDLAKYSASGKLDKLKGLNKGERDMLDTLYAAGDTRAQFMEDMKLNVLGSPALAAWSKTMSVLGWPMEVSERFNRASLALAAYRAARAGDVVDKGKMGHDAAVEFARGVVNDAHFVYQKGNMPQPLRGSDAGKMLSSAYQFRRFTHNMLGLWSHMWKSGDRGKKALARSFAGLIGLGGLAAVPLYKTFMAAMMGLTGDDWEEKVRRLVGGGTMADLFIYGFPSLGGVQLAGSIGMDLPVVSEMGSKKYGNPVLDLVGVPGAFLKEGGQSLAALAAGNIGRAAAMSPFTPNVIRAPMEAYRLATEGAFTQSGRPIPKLGEHGPMKLTTAQAIAKALGFSPVELANQYAAAQSLEAQNEFRLETQSKFANQYANAKRRNDLDEMREIRAQVKEWNAQAIKDRKRHLVIDLATAVRSRGREQGPPKRMMGRAKEMQEVY